MKHLTTDQVTRLLDHAGAPRHRLLLALCYEHGLRVSEAIALTPSRVKNGYLCTHPGKDGNRTIQRLSVATLLLWNAETQNLAPTFRVFPFTRQWASSIFHRAAFKSGIVLSPRQGIHTLRHSIAHHLLDSNAPLPVVQRKLGHKSLSSTGCYLLASDDDCDMWTARTLSA